MIEIFIIWMSFAFVCGLILYTAGVSVIVQFIASCFLGGWCAIIFGRFELLPLMIIGWMLGDITIPASKQMVSNALKSIRRKKR